MTEQASRRTSIVRWLRDRMAATPPTSTEIATLVKAAVAAGLAWWLAGVVADVQDPLLASMTAVVVVQVSVRSSVTLAIQRCAAVVAGVLLALGLAGTLPLNGLVVGAIVALSLGVAQLILRLPNSAARQLPVSMLVVLSTVASSPEVSGWRRAAGTLVGAGVAVTISLILPASRLADARQTLKRLGSQLGGILESMGAGLQESWTSEQAESWRRAALAASDQLLGQATEAVGHASEIARWNVRDRRHRDVLASYESALPRLERTAIGVSVIARGLDDWVRASGGEHQPMAAVGALLDALGRAVRAVVDSVVAQRDGSTVEAAVSEVHARRARCGHGATRRARLALEDDGGTESGPARAEWLDYVALLVQVDRMVVDLGAPLESSTP
jgi:uncharacterized membrane protein YgaE (UPF0421/DUF939 family)